MNLWKQMVATTKICAVNILQENQTPKLIMTHEIQLSLFTYFFVNRVRIYKDKDTTLPQKIPPPLELTHPGVKLVYIPKLITEVNRVHVMMIWVVNFQT